MVRLFSEACAMITERFYFIVLLPALHSLSLSSIVVFVFASGSRQMLEYREDLIWRGTTHR